MLVRDQRAVKVTLVLLLTESVLSQEKWRRDYGELDKSLLRGDDDGYEDLQHDECRVGAGGDKACAADKKDFRTKVTDHCDIRDKRLWKTNSLDYRISFKKLPKVRGFEPESNKTLDPPLRNVKGRIGDIDVTSSPVELDSTVLSRNRTSGLHWNNCDENTRSETNSIERRRRHEDVFKLKDQNDKKNSYKNLSFRMKSTPDQFVYQGLGTENKAVKRFNTTIPELPEMDAINAFTERQERQGLKINETDDIDTLWNEFVLGLNGSENFEDVEHRIIGGKLTPISDVPYLVVILRFHREICGGTIITLRHVLTAAHCVTIKGIRNPRYIVMRPDDYTLRYGSSSSEQGGNLIAAGHFFVHPDYLSRSDIHIYMDLAIIWLPSSIDESVGSVAKLPERGTHLGQFEQMVVRGTTCFVAGWGRTSKPFRKRPKRSLLVGANLKLLDLDKCSQIYSEHGYNISKQAHICTYSEGTDACHGDSGGGLYHDNEVWGVTSWGVGCAEKNIPGVFARVDTNLDFINGVMEIEPKMMHTSLAPRLSDSSEYTPIFLLYLFVYKFFQL